MITHDIMEALMLADKIFLLSHLPMRIIKEIDLSNLPKPRYHLDFELAEMAENIFFTLKGELINA
jgi:NitT/TauT family transport system ATP-binding protein